MTRDDLIQMAKKAGFENAEEPGFWISNGFYILEIEMFALLVADAERQACLKICEEAVHKNWLVEDCGAAILARGE
jgi:hypothetical protein